MLIAPNTRLTIFVRGEPRAMRIPTSWVRWFTL
jgi:hypothetical protein